MTTELKEKEKKNPALVHFGMSIVKIIDFSMLMWYNSPWIHMLSTADSSQPETETFSKGYQLERTISCTQNRGSSK